MIEVGTGRDIQAFEEHMISLLQCDDMANANFHPCAEGILVEVDMYLHLRADQ